LSLRSLKGAGGPASDDHVSGVNYPQNFKKIIGDNGYLSQQVLNLEGTGFRFKQWTKAVAALDKVIYKSL